MVVGSGWLLLWLTASWATTNCLCSKETLSQLKHVHRHKHTFDKHTHGQLLNSLYTWTHTGGTTFIKCTIKRLTSNCFFSLCKRNKNNRTMQCKLLNMLSDKFLTIWWDRPTYLCSWLSLTIHEYDWHVPYSTPPLRLWDELLTSESTTISSLTSHSQVCTRMAAILLHSNAW